MSNFDFGQKEIAFKDSQKQRQVSDILTIDLIISCFLTKCLVIWKRPLVYCRLLGRWASNDAAFPQDINKIYLALVYLKTARTQFVQFVQCV